MKAKYIIFIFVLLIAGYLVYKHQSLTHSVADGDGCVDVVKTNQEAAAISQNNSQYTLTTKSILDASSEGGEQTNYSLDNHLVLVKQSYYGENGKSQVSFYFRNGKVFYVHKENTEYLLPLSEDPSGKTKNIEIKDFYLNDNEILCLWYLNQKPQIINQNSQDLVAYLLSTLKN